MDPQGVPTSGSSSSGGRVGSRRPNVLVILADDLGFSDIGCYGSEIDTPALDRLARGGVRMTQFYNTARCSPARASLLTGLHPHQTGVGVLVGDERPLGYAGRLGEGSATLAEVLAPAGYGTLMAGKWHLTDALTEPDGAWPLQRGFERFHGILAGSATYYHPFSLHHGLDPVVEFAPDYHLTSDIGRAAAEQIAEHCRDRPQDPFLSYVAFTAPHWPLHATEEEIAAHEGKYDCGWDELRRRRLARQVELGIVAEATVLSERDTEVPAWDEAADHEWQARRMAVYAAQVTAMDRAIARIVATLEEHGELDNTLIMFLADNGGCAEELPWMWADERPGFKKSIPTRTPAGARVRVGNDPRTDPGPADTFASYGLPWANVSNTPFREYKHWVHEGGIATPMIIHWPAGLAGRGSLDHVPHQLPDVMATVLDVTGAAYPGVRDGHTVPPCEGRSMLPDLRGEVPTEDQDLFFEHEGNCGLRRGRWKLVRKHGGSWELYDMDLDRIEANDVAMQHPERVVEMATAYQRWADRCGVLDRSLVLAVKRPGAGAATVWRSSRTRQEAAEASR